MLLYKIMRTTKTLFMSIGLMLVAAIAISGQTSLPDLKGGSVDVQAQKGKVVILAVGATWLPLSGKQADFTTTLAKRYAGKNVVVYFVATDSANARSKNFASDDDIKKFAADRGLNVPVLRDSDGAATLRKFNIDQLPSFVILDKNGRVVGEPFGGIDPKFDITAPISKAVDALL